MLCWGTCSRLQQKGETHKRWRNKQRVVEWGGHVQSSLAKKTSHNPYPRSLFESHTNLDIQTNFRHSSCPIIKIYCQLIQGQFFFQKLPQIPLEQVSTCSLLDALGPWQVPRHFKVSDGKKSRFVPKRMNIHFRWITSFVNLSSQNMRKPKHWRRHLSFVCLRC